MIVAVAVLASMTFVLAVMLLCVAGAQHNAIQELTADLKKLRQDGFEVVAEFVAAEAEPTGILPERGKPPKRTH